MCLLAKVTLRHNIFYYNDFSNFFPKIKSESITTNFGGAMMVPTSPNCQRFIFVTIIEIFDWMAEIATGNNPTHCYKLGMLKINTSIESLLL